MTRLDNLGILGTGALGGAIARRLLQTGAIAPDRLWLANRSGGRAAFEAWPEVHVTTDGQRLADECRTILLALPPDEAGKLAIRATDRLVLSVMAGVSLGRIATATGTDRVVRAMSNPAAEIGLAYSPWVAGAAVTEADRAFVSVLLGVCGNADEVPDEAQIDIFTALTGPVPGFVACFADCMVRYAIDRGIAPEIALRAVRQLFHASGVMLGTQPPSPAEHVRAMLDYAGTTAAGLETMRHGSLAAAIEAGLEAAVARARGIAGPG